MDSTVDHYIWQRRIHHGVRYQKSAVPFPDSVSIGLEFNAALERKEKLDQRLLTNAVMLELCDFAKTVTKSEAYFLFEMLEFNFDLGVDLDDNVQLYEYAVRVHSKIKQVKEQIKMKPLRWNEAFALPDRNVIMGLTASEQSARYCPKWNKMVDTSVLTGGSRNSQSSENQKTASNLCIIKRPGFRLTGGAYPHCKKLGVSLIVRPDNARKQKLDPNLVTSGVMMELLDFSKALCGTHTNIVQNLVKQNFGLELDSMLFRMFISKLMERKNTNLKPEARDAFRKEPCKIPIKKQEQEHKKRKKTESDYEELERLTIVSKRRGTLRHRDNNTEDIWQDSDLSYMCPVDFDTDMQSGTQAEPANVMFESCLSVETKSPVCLDVKQEQEEVIVSPAQPQTNGHNLSLVNLPPKNTTLNTVFNLFSEDKNEDINVKTLKQKLWTRRSARCKQILKSRRVNDRFAHCRAIGLDFNVGSGNKQNMDSQLLTNFVLWELHKFATAMTKSFSSFLLDILDDNFNLTQQDEHLQHKFIIYVASKERLLQTHPDREKMEFLSRPFRFPEVYNMNDDTSDSDIGEDTETEQQTNWESPALPTHQQPDMESLPFCNMLGVNLWSTERRLANQKLDLTLLTTGAVFEMVSLVRALCGTVYEIVSDILEHNFDVDLQSGATEAAEVIQKWYATRKSVVKGKYLSQKVKRWLNMVVPLNGHTELKSKSLTGDQLEDRDAEDLKPVGKMGAFHENVQQVEKVNHYHTCKEIGLDLEVGFKSEAKTKLDLRVLTRGVLFEVHQYVEQNCNRYVPALYEILEYNFDLSSQKHRKVDFAWSIASQVIAMAGKNGRKGDYLNKVFELPFEVSESSKIVCKEEPEDAFSELDLSDNSDIMFVRELKPVDIEVEID